MTATPAARERIVVDMAKAGMRFGPHPVLHDITLTADSSKRLGVVGESGSGKSTLSRLLVGLSAPTEGTVVVNGTPWRSVRRGDALRRHVQMIQQDPYAQLTPHLTARSAISEAVHVSRGLGRADAAAVAGELLAAVGLSPADGRRKPRQLSGGQCQRVAIARALASNATLLVADEPTSALDVSVQAQIINLILELTAERTRGLVIVSHDLAVIRHLTDELVVLYQGRIVERGRTLEVLDSPRHEHTRQLIAASAIGA